MVSVEHPVRQTAPSVRHNAASGGAAHSGELGAQADAFENLARVPSEVLRCRHSGARAGLEFMISEVVDTSPGLSPCAVLFRDLHAQVEGQPKNSAIEELVMQ